MEENGGSIDAAMAQAFAPRAMGQKQPWRAYYYFGVHRLDKKDPVQPYAHRDGDAPHTPEEYQEHPELIYVPQRGDVIREAAIVAVPGDYGTPERNCLFIYCDECTTHNDKGHRVRVEVDELQKQGFYKPCDNPDKNPDLRRHTVFIPPKQYVWPMLADDREPSALACCINRGVGQFEHVRDEMRAWLGGAETRLPDVHGQTADYEKEYNPFPPLRERIASMPKATLLKVVAAVVLVVGGAVGLYVFNEHRGKEAAAERTRVHQSWTSQFAEIQRMPNKTDARNKARALLQEVRKGRAEPGLTTKEDSFLWELEEKVARFAEGG